MLWLVKIWQVSSCRKFLQHLETCLLWQLKLTEFFINLWCFLLSFSTGCIKWNTATINSLLLFMAGLFIEFLVGKCAACQSWKSDFGWHRFRFFTLLDAGWKVPQAIMALLDSFQELHLKWQAWVIIVYSVCFFYFILFISSFISRAQFMRLVCARLY